MTDRSLSEMTETEVRQLIQEEFKHGVEQHFCRYSIDPEIIRQLDSEARRIGKGDAEKGVSIWTDNHRTVYRWRHTLDNVSAWAGRAVVMAIVGLFLAIIGIGTMSFINRG